MDLPDIETVSAEQAAFGAVLGLVLHGQPLGVALARINDVVQQRFLGVLPGRPTQRQLELLDQWGLADDVQSMGVASAMIGCALRQLDLNAIRDQQLEPGASVVNRKDPERRRRIISSIKPWGLVYFKGGAGSKAPARVLERVPDAQSGVPDGVRQSLRVSRG